MSNIINDLNERVIKESKESVLYCSKAVVHYLQKIEDVSIGKFPKEMLPLYHKEVDRNIDRICSIRNSLVPRNQSYVAVLAARKPVTA